MLLHVASLKARSQLAVVAGISLAYVLCREYSTSPSMKMSLVPQLGGSVEVNEVIFCGSSTVKSIAVIEPIYSLFSWAFLYCKSGIKSK